MRMTVKKCLVCGIETSGTYAKMTCSDACRVAMFRMIKNNRMPDFYDLAKNNGQKVPKIKAETKKQVIVEEKKYVKDNAKEGELTAFQIYQRKKLGIK